MGYGNYSLLFLGIVFRADLGRVNVSHTRVPKSYPLHGGHRRGRYSLDLRKPGGSQEASGPFIFDRTKRKIEHCYSLLPSSGFINFPRAQWLWLSVPPGR